MFRFGRPCDALAAVVSHYVHFRDVPIDHEFDLFLPNGQVDLVIDLGDEAKPVMDNGTRHVRQTVRGAWLSGTRTKPITIPAGRGAEHFIVQFRSGHSLKLLGFPLLEITDTVVEAEHLLPWIAGELRPRLLESPDEAKFAVADAVFLSFLSSREIHPLVSGLVPLLARDSRLWNAAALEDLTGYTSRYVADQFKLHLGLAPKTWLRLLRFQRALTVLGEGASAADTALSCGYYDQSHLSNEFQDFAGLTPSGYLHRKLLDPYYLPAG